MGFGFAFERQYVHDLGLRFALLLSTFILGGVSFSGDVHAQTPDMNSDCYAPTVPLTLGLKKAFLDEVRILATKAESDHGIPASIFAAMAINESGYGTTKLALATNNFLSYKWNSEGGPGGRRTYILDCQPPEDENNRYVVFKTRADSADFVAGRLETSQYYKAGTDTYKAAIKVGADRKQAAIKWLQTIAPAYNPYKTDNYINKLTAVAGNPLNIAEPASSDSLWYLASATKTEVADRPLATHVAAVKAAQTSAYIATNRCPFLSADMLGWPHELVRECVYAKGSAALKAKVYLLDISAETIASWIETACSQELSGNSSCFKTVLECGRTNSSMMFPVSGNLLEDMDKKPWKNYFFRNGMTVTMKGQKNETTLQIPLDRQEQLALSGLDNINSIPSGVTRFWRTNPAQFRKRFPEGGFDGKPDTAEKRTKWLNLVQVEILNALKSPHNRLLEAWIAAHPVTLSSGVCPSDSDK